MKHLLLFSVAVSASGCSIAQRLADRSKLRGSASTSNGALWDRGTDRGKGLLIQNFCTLAVAAQGATEPQVVRADGKKRENVFSP